MRRVGRGSDGAALNVATRDGAGPTIVVLHYWGGSARMWDPVLDELPGRAALALDQRGWGGSATAPGPYDLATLAADALAVTADLTDWVLVGHSMGGKVAQLVAASRPAGLRGLVLVAPAPPEPAPSVTPEHQTQLAHAYDTRASVAFALDHVLTSRPLTAAQRRQVIADSLAAPAAARDEWPLHGIAADITGEAARIDVPVCVVVGAADRVELPDVLRSHLLPHLSGASFTVVPDVGHLLPLEAPAAVAKQIAALSAPAPGRG